MIYSVGFKTAVIAHIKDYYDGFKTITIGLKF